MKERQPEMRTTGKNTLEELNYVYEELKKYQDFQNKMVLYSPDSTTNSNDTDYSLNYIKLIIKMLGNEKSTQHQLQEEIEQQSEEYLTRDAKAIAKELVDGYFFWNTNERINRLLSQKTELENMFFTEEQQRLNEKLTMIISNNEMAEELGLQAKNMVDLLLTKEIELKDDDKSPVEALREIFAALSDEDNRLLAYTLESMYGYYPAKLPT